ncbi:MAG: hypothetical protein M1118_14110 [Chloroflexi bacterium]|nr:hypothetical protein [Chloroflexota bacterium]
MATVTAGVLLTSGAGAVVVQHVRTAPQAMATASTTTTSSLNSPSLRGETPLKQVLDQLVTKGTISTPQEGAILSAWQQYAQSHPQSQRPLHGPGFLHADFSVIASALHLTRTQLLTDLRKGQTIDQIAQSQNVPIATVTSTILAHAKSRLDAAVAANKLTQAQETAMLTNLSDRLGTLFSQSVTKFHHGQERHPWGRARSSTATGTAATTVPLH